MEEQHDFFSFSETGGYGEYLQPVACHICHHRKETYLQEVKEAKTQKEADLRMKKRKATHNRAELPVPGVPNTTYFLFLLCS
jgi:hypothetical protein